LSPDRYHPLSSHQQWLNDLSKNHRNVQLEEIGRSFEGRPLLLMKICHTGKCGNKPVYWIDAGIHAREWIGPAVLAYFTEKLVSDKPKYKRLRRMYDWYVLTIVNPDGYQETWAGEKEWRKNRNNVSKRMCGEEYGTDLNRNFGYFWSDNRLSVTDPCSGNYHGDSAFSEPETRAIRDVLWKRKGDVKVFCSIHSKGEKIIIPWGHNNDVFDKSRKILKVLEHGRRAMGERGPHYTIGNVMQAFGTFVHGGSPNWAAGRLGARIPFVIEMVRGGGPRNPAEDQILSEAETFRRFTEAVAIKALDIT